MERTVPIRSSEEIDLYLRTIYSLLRSTKKCASERLKASTPAQILPCTCTPKKTSRIHPPCSILCSACQKRSSMSKVILGQASTSFIERGYQDIESWQEVSTRASPQVLLQWRRYPGMFYCITIRYRRCRPRSNRLADRMEQTALSDQHIAGRSA